MKLKTFRITNYKSIIDSGECSVEDTITILAGKNEAGKTAILEALEDFSFSNTIKESAVPLFRKEKLPQITLTFVASKSELEKTLEGTGLTNFKDNTKIILTKSYPGNTYAVPDETFNELGFSNSIPPELDTTVLQSKYDNLRTKVTPFHPSVLQLVPPFDLADINTFKNGLSEFINAPKTEITPNEELVVINQIAQEILSLLDSPTTDTRRGKITEALTKIIPNFILFSSFDDVFPSVIGVEEAKTNPLLQDLDLISDLKLETLTGGNPPDLMKHLRLLNQRMKNDYQKYWTQDVTNLQANYNNNELHFFIEEDGEFYSPQVRSKGKQWHLAFYIRISARSAEDKTNIILIDEPGLFLHATAQKDILKKLEDSAKKSQVIFTTHSPYLLEQDNFIRIRLVQRGVIPKIIEQSQLDEATADNKRLFSDLETRYEKHTHKDGEKNYWKIKEQPMTEDEENALRNSLIKLGYNIGTSLEDKLHKVSDKETLTPIITAIGLELTAGIVSVDKKKNVVCEGLSDVFYMQAFNKLLAKTDINFVFGGGSGNMPIVGTVLSGWGCNVLYLYDNDKGKKDGEKNLKKNWLITTDYILSVVNKVSGSIEDIFSEEDFKKYIIEDSKAIIATTNSEYLKAENKEKVILSKTFYRACENGNVNLSPETEKNITSVFEELQKRFSQEF